jgi:hypothetical protein
MYTIGVFNFKIYVATSRRMMNLVQKNSATLSFWPFLQWAGRFAADVNDHTHELLGGSLSRELSIAQNRQLEPGPGLDEQNVRMGEGLLVMMAELLQDATGGDDDDGKRNVKVMLMGWVSDLTMQASSRGIWGTSHPFRAPEVREAFWDWHSYMSLHMSGPRFLGAPGYAAREKVFAAFREYHKAVPADASQLVRTRWRVFAEQGVEDHEEVVKLDAHLSQAVFPNSNRTAFWFVWELFSRPSVLDEVRAEVQSHAIARDSSGTTILDVGALKSRCPLLLSVLQETQRTRHQAAMARQVMVDTTIDDGKYLLKKGAYVQMPAQPIHNDTAIWGPAAAEFDPYRFVNNTATGQKQKVAPGAFLAWGAAPHVCPARQFMTTELLIMGALLAMRVDLVPTAHEGDWGRAKPALKHKELVTVAGPTRDVEVKVVPRGGWQGEWKLEMGQSLSRISLASG